MLCNKMRNNPISTDDFCLAIGIVKCVIILAKMLNGRHCSSKIFTRHNLGNAMATFAAIVFLLNCFQHDFVFFAGRPTFLGLDSQASKSCGSICQSRPTLRAGNLPRRMAC